jgi:arylsulfatase A-like enzyme
LKIATMQSLTLLFIITVLFSCQPKNEAPPLRPNIIYILADQWRAQDIGYAGNREVKTPNLDQLAAKSVVFTTAVSGCPVCSPHRASLLTGQYPLTHGVFYNDKPLPNEALTIAEVLKEEGYQTGYIGKWHVNGRSENETVQESRNAPVPQDRRQGFDFWKVNECTHDYTSGFYYDEQNQKHFWEGYDAFVQTDTAIQYMQTHAGKDPFLLFLAWGPPHAPYQTAPEVYQQIYNDPEEITLRENVPREEAAKAREQIAGYYAHIAALDKALGDILQALKENDLEKNTILVFTSDHGDMLWSHGMEKKQKPWDESILVPFLVHYPAQLGTAGKKIELPINTPDIMPTLLGLSDVSIPGTVEGKDYSALMKSDAQSLQDSAALIQCPVPFHQWNYQKGGREYRGVRTPRYTYAHDLQGPWLLYDNQQDPFQMSNLINQPAYAEIQASLEEKLKEKLTATHDEFLPGDAYMQRWGYTYDPQDSLRAIFVEQPEH